MVTYLSTFISGFQEVVKELTLKYVKGVKILEVFDGAIIYQSEVDINRIRQLAFFNNSFVLLKKFDNEGDFGKMANAIFESRGMFGELRKFVGKKDKYFKIMFSNENEFVSFDKVFLKRLEIKIIDESGKNFNVDINKPDFEFWFLRRREAGFFLLRFTNITHTKLNKGELRSELCFILNYLAEPKKEDIFMDPFAGYGSIVYSRAKNFPTKLVVINDSDKAHNGFWNKKLDSIKGLEIVRKNQDALNFKTEKENSVDKIVSDPPWGEYWKIENTDEFYSKMLSEFARIVRKNGIVVLLMNRTDFFQKVLDKFGKEFKTLVKIDILVNGKKASVYKLKRI